MTFALVSLATDRDQETAGMISRDSFNAYANRYGMDTLIPRSLDENLHATKVNLIIQALTRFDRVIYIEPHCIIRFDCPNLLDLVPIESIAMFEEGDSRPEAKAKVNASKLYHSGVIVASREHIPFFERILSGENKPLDVEPKILPLHFKFNCMRHTVPISGEPIEDAFIVNTEGDLSLLKELKEKFEAFESSGIPPLRKKILIDAPGALGDCVAMEPVVRYIAEELHPEAMIKVRSDFPDVFRHLMLSRKDKFHVVPESIQGDWFKDYCHVDLVRKLGYASFNMMHPIDYGALAAFGGHLPNHGRGIKLMTSASYDSVRGYVLIHAGASWKSKTFPTSFWQEVIDLLLEHEFKVALIGKDYEDGSRGTVKGLDASRCLDLRNSLSLQQLMAVIRDASILVSNDSSPVHISGAFDKPTIMITSAKHPDFIWPHREASLNVTLGNPIEAATPKIGVINNSSVDNCTDEELSRALPHPHAVLLAVVCRYRK